MSEPRQNLKDSFFQELEAWAIGQMRQSQESIAVMNEVREQFPDDWEVQELIRSIIFDEIQIIESMKEEAKRAKAAGKESA
jgi:hypothetical protein